jgi:hypothetical protein
MELFDYKKTAVHYGISKEIQKKICLDVIEEFPNDPLMAELHIIRAYHRIYMKVQKLNKKIHDKNLS